MRNDKYWKYGCFAVAAVMLLVCIHLARLDVLLRKYCKDVELESFFGEKGLPLLMLLVAAYAGFALWQWIAERPPARRRMITVTLVAVCMFAVLANGYVDYHDAVFQQSSHQKKYRKAYDKGLVYDLKSLFK